MGIRVLLGGAGTMIPSMDPRSIFHNHSKSLYRRVTHPLVDLYCGSVVQYVTLYSTCLDKPSPTLCGSLTSTCSVPVGSSYPAGAVTDTEGGSGLGPTASETPRVPRLPGDFGAVPDVWVAEGEAGVSMAETGPGREPPPETMREPRSREGTRVDVCWASEESGGAPTSRGSFKTERILLQLASDVRLLSVDDAEYPRFRGGEVLLGLRGVRRLFPRDLGERLALLLPLDPTNPVAVEEVLLRLLRDPAAARG